MAQTNPTSTEPSTVDQAERVRAIRARLPGQILTQRIEMARLTYGPLYTLAQLRERIGQLLPRRLGYIRTATLEPIETYRERIPDAALLKWDDAVNTGLFDRFWVAAPAYFRERQVDPWIVGEITGAGLFAVVAQWDV
jgi:hypothetical protein